MDYRKILLFWGVIVGSTVLSSALYAGSGKKEGAHSDPVQSLADFLDEPKKQRGSIDQHSFARKSLSKQKARRAKELLWKDFRARRKKALKKLKFLQDFPGAFDGGVVRTEDWHMKFRYRIYGKKPENGRRLWISLHGGGKAPAKIHDQQWMNQLKLYQPDEGIYLAPRSPEDHQWDMWFRPHMDALYDRLITNMVVAKDVNPNRVYLMGFSAGGDGVYQVGARMADRWAAAAMMAGHPNDTSPLNYRNVPFTIHVGGNDSAYDRNKKAREWKKKLDRLEKKDPEGYEHWVPSYPNKGHWMDREDRKAVPWMSKYERDPVPEQVVWVQDETTHARRFWLGVNEKSQVDEAKLIARYDRQTVTIEGYEKVDRVRVFLDDRMMDLDDRIKIQVKDKTVYEGHVDRTIQTIAYTLQGRYDPELMFSAAINVDLP